MNRPITTFEADLHAAVEFFSNDEVARELPFMHSFPKNCCEVVTALFAQALSSKYVSSNVVRVCGTKPNTSEQHFWVEVAGLTIDPTAHQFEGAAQPFIGKTSSPLGAVYSEVREETTSEALLALRSLNIDASMQATVLQRLVAKLGPNPSIEGTSASGLRPLADALHVKR